MKNKFILILFFLLCKCYNNYVNSTFEHFFDRSINRIVYNSTIPQNYEYKNIIQHSGIFINDFGDFNSCQNLEEAKYILLKYQINSYYEFKIGLCIIKEIEMEYLITNKDKFLILFKNYFKEVYIERLEFVDSANYINYYNQSSYRLFVIFICILTLIIVLNILSCFVNFKNKFLNYFNFIKNSKPFLSVFYNNKISDQNVQNNSLEIFNGIRSIASFMVIYGHMFILPFFKEIINFDEFHKFPSKIEAIFILACFYSVDIFFYLSGFFLYLSLQKYINLQTSKIKIFFKFLFYRYVRLFPLLALIIILFIISPMDLNTPGLMSFDNNTIDMCRKYWWHNLLFIGNLVEYEYRMCAFHTWYLQNDMQFFIIVSLVILIFYKSKILHNIILLSLLVLSCCYHFISSYENKQKFDFRKLVALEGSFWTKFYFSPLSRIPTFILGVFFCQLYVDFKNSSKENNLASLINKNIQNNKKITSATFVITLFCLVYSIVSLYFPNNYELSTFFNAFICTFNKVIFIIGLGLLIQLIILGKLNILKKILSLKIFSFISKISYALYLFHFNFIFPSFQNAKNVEFSFTNFTLYTLIYYFPCVIFCFLITVAIDIPIFHMIKDAFLIEEDNKKNK